MAAEYEFKFRVDRRDFIPISAAFPQPGREIQMETVYYDTPSGAFAARRYTLRRRLENGVSVCTLKLPAGDAREEFETENAFIEAALPQFLAQGAPAEVAELAREGLYPICGAKFTRIAKTIPITDGEAELALAQQVKGTGYLHFMTVNPTLPGWRDDLKRAVQKLEIKGVRLVPGFQGYTLEDPCVAELCGCLREYGLPLILTLRMKDERTMYMLQPRSIPLEEIAAFLDRNRELPTLLTHIRAAEVEALLPQFAGRENVFADISGFKDGMFVLDRMVLETEAREHLVYGSGAPLMEMYATAMQIDTARIPEDRKEALFAGEKLLRCCP